MVVYGVANVQLFSSLTLALDRSKWSASCPGTLCYQGKRPLYPSNIGQVGPRARLDVAEKR